MARPTIFKPAHVETARALAFAGATDREVADFLKVAERTIHRWKIDHPEFGEALQTGKDAADRRVEHSLYRKAIGYSFDSEKIWHWEGKVVRAACVEHVPPSDVAAIFWLKNRKPDQYREKSQVEVTGNLDRAALIAAARARVAQRDDQLRAEGKPLPPRPARDDRNEGEDDA